MLDYTYKSLLTTLSIVYHDRLGYSIHDYFINSIWRIWYNCRNGRNYVRRFLCLGRCRSNKRRTTIIMPVYRKRIKCLNCPTTILKTPKMGKSWKEEQLCYDCHYILKVRIWCILIRWLKTESICIWYLLWPCDQAFYLRQGHWDRLLWTIWVWSRHTPFLWVQDYLQGW